MGQKSVHTLPAGWNGSSGPDLKYTLNLFTPLFFGKLTDPTLIASPSAMTKTVERVPLVVKTPFFRRADLERVLSASSSTLTNLMSSSGILCSLSIPSTSLHGAGVEGGGVNVEPVAEDLKKNNHEIHFN